MSNPEKPKAMALPNPIFRYVLSPLSVLISLVAIDYSNREYGLTISMAPPVGVLTICLFWSGLRANILSAIFITYYASQVFNDSPARLLQLLAFSVWPIAIVGGLLKRRLVESVKEAEQQRLKAEINQTKADFVDNLNGNIEYLREINQDLIKLSLAVGMLTRDDIVEAINVIQDKTANLAQRAIGWQQLAEAKNIVKGKEE